MIISLVKTIPPLYFGVKTEPPQLPGSADEAVKANHGSFPPHYPGMGVGRWLQMTGALRNDQKYMGTKWHGYEMTMSELSKF